jgi:hypothetical protein
MDAATDRRIETVGADDQGGGRSSPRRCKDYTATVRVAAMPPLTMPPVVASSRKMWQEYENGKVC